MCVCVCVTLTVYSPSAASLLFIYANHIVSTIDFCFSTGAKPTVHSTSDITGTGLGRSGDLRY